MQTQRTVEPCIMFRFCRTLVSSLRQDLANSLEPCLLQRSAQNNVSCVSYSKTKKLVSSDISYCKINDSPVRPLRLMNFRVPLMFHY